MSQLQTLIVLVMTLTGGIASADVIVRVQVLEQKAEAPAAAPPAGAEPADEPVDLKKADPVVTIETVAPVGGSFLARTTVGKQNIELKGTVKQSGNDPYRVSVKFSNRAEGLGQQVSTVVELPLDKPHVISGLTGGSGQLAVVLTILNEPAK